MKELSIVKRMVADGQLSQEVAEKYFPELKESEGERIKKAIIEHFEGSHSSMYPYKGFTKKQILAWLEKQENKDSQVILPNILWHDGNEEPEEQCEILCEWESNDAVWHDVAFYHADTKTFWNGAEKIEAVVRWIYVNEILEKQGEQEHVIAPKFEIGDTIRNKITNEVFTITNRCISLEYYHDINHLHEIKFSEQDNWELVKQKPTDKVEPKFKVGDWITDGHLHCKISDVLDDRYIVDAKFAKRSAILFKDRERWHLWTIRDAKDGDVLVVNNEVFIYAHRKQMYSIAVAHCFIDSASAFHFDGEFGYMENGDSIHPATKEQRDTLEKAMADAGYTFDFEKKEFKKINNYGNN